ncbi:MAG: hypothetical protein KDK36_18470, partial [Leptospiraceae bacterium]|nr:hypothetical protein [Leptospiraceae bacterium]
YKTPEALKKSLNTEVKIPKYIPDGYVIEEIQVLNLYDTKLFIEKYTDGLNSMFVSYRTRPNFFLTLIAGNFSLSLLHKIGDLSYHAPYNYFTNETVEHLVVAFGDLYPNDLEKVAKSMDLK